jgi:hypothetical protein
MKPVHVFAFAVLVACSKRNDPVALCKDIEKAGAASGCAKTGVSGATWQGASAAAQFSEPGTGAHKGTVLVYPDEEKFRSVRKYVQDHEAEVTAKTRVYVRDDTRTLVLLDVAYADADRVEKSLDLIVLAAPPPPTPSAVPTIASTTTATSTATATATTPDTTDDTEGPPTRARLGETITLSDSTWVVLEARDAGKVLASNSEFNEETKTTTGRFIQVHYRITNNGTKEEMLLDRPKLVDQKGRQFGPVDMETFYIPRKAKTVGLDTIQPSLPKEYWTVIEVPADSRDLAFRVHTFSLLGPTRDVPLGL